MDNLWALNFYTCFYHYGAIGSTDINDYAYHMAVLSLLMHSLYVQGESCFFIYKEFILFGGVNNVNKTLDGLVYAVVLL